MLLVNVDFGLQMLISQSTSTIMCSWYLGIKGFSFHLYNFCSATSFCDCYSCYHFHMKFKYLELIVGKVVSSSQNAFLDGRQILYAMLIVNETWWKAIIVVCFASFILRKPMFILLGFLVLALKKKGFWGEMD